ncbi:ABC-2 type transport system ATP-binding protein [Methylobacillus rhizosphaerae]|uniref:ABC-2 type transport system ATP-binding protein n=1 Tax=Methylobacillus rhizosphaerae TaxID=551994 RepID=A0A238Y193_9PROT|nr:ABC transporter ATP-binding protein [Methylobacillus rhizosphaerae]SNR64384.1 ABC-2 type transport system ATP-binding protein [Methylobacillus rhizosphaerae]
MHPEFVIEVSGLYKYFDQFCAINDLQFQARKGVTTALLGGNGAGKTTTIAMLLGLLTPSQGKIHILGEDMLQHRYRLLHRMNFSSPYVDLPQRLTIRQNLTVYGHLYRLPRLKERIAELAQALNLDTLLDKRYGQLSAGQKTRVSLAKSLLNKPELLLMDEPTASLDPDTADSIRSYLEQYQRDTGASILLASHNMAEVERMASDVIMMRKGQVVDTGTPDELLARYGRNNLEEVFIDIARHKESA